MRRTRPRASRVLLVLSVLIAAVATLAVRARLAGLEARAAASGPGRSVVVAEATLDRGTSLAPAMVTIRRIPVRYLPPGALSSEEAVLGRTLATEVVDGEAITRARLAPAGGPVAALVPPSFRAVAIPSALPAAAIRPGDRVDVHATFATGQPHTETVVAGAEVVSILPTGPATGGPASVNLIVLVGPESAERLAFARTFADLSVALVSAEETPALAAESEAGR